ncbi:MAG: PHP domain-containing protein [Candidatus Krumholzibacteria bacterium]|nr:PHP domain-containing protein [Candidatus Krumholzibacteria bacterium]
MNRPEKVCDLHLHSYYSDGSLSPSELVSRGENAGLAAISITDHDTLSGQNEAIQAAMGRTIEVLPGIEFSVMIDETEVHILGYFVDIYNREISSCCDGLEVARHERAVRIVKKLRALDLDVSMEEVAALSGRGTVGRLHIARVLLSRKYISNIQEAFVRYLGNGKSAFVPRKILSIAEATEVIRTAGGVAVWAHPGSAIRRAGLLRKLLDAGISGMEAYHPNHTPGITRDIMAAGEKFGLVCTGGSDFHFTEAMKADIGGVYIEYGAVVKLRELAGDI